MRHALALACTAVGAVALAGILVGSLTCARFLYPAYLAVEWADGR